MTDPVTTPALRRKRAAARLVIVFERLWPALWPPLGVIGLYVAFALLDLPALLAPWPRAILFALMLAASLGLGWRGLRQMRIPGTAEADRRLERDTGLRHRPLAALQDRPALGGPGSDALWHAHLTRVAAQIDRLRLAPPRPGLAARDPRALRGGLIVLLAASLLVAGADAPARLWRAAWPGLPALAPGLPVEVQAWATPPAYTRLPPVLLRSSAATVTLPAGSHLTVSVTGGRTAPTLRLGHETTEFKALDAASWQAERDLTTGGPLAVARGGTLASWQVSLIPDHPPTVSFAGPPGPAPGPVPAGSAGGIRLPWRADDDYGVVSAQAELRLRDRPGATPLRLAMPVSGAPRHGHGVLTQDLTSHPWAGLPVIARLVAKDALGQEGRSGDAAFILPERQFHNPVAAAIVSIRQALSLHPQGGSAAAAALDAIAAAPKAFDGSTAVFLNLEGIAGLLRHGRAPQTTGTAQAQMWRLALALEEGAAARTEKALAAAERALQDALRAPPTSTAMRAELEKRLKAFEDALRRHMQALAEQARRNGVTAEDMRDASPDTERQIQAEIQAMRDAVKHGRTEDAQRRLAQLEQMLQRMQAAQKGAGQQQRAAQAQAKQGREQMGAVQDMVRREGGLLDHTQRRVKPEDPFGPPEPAANPQREADARVQQALRLALGELMQRFGDLAGKVPQPLSDADIAMRGAVQSLALGQDRAAREAERRAIAALQKGGRAMQQKMAQMGLQVGPGGQRQGQGGQQQGEDGRQQGGGRGSSGQDGQFGRNDGNGLYDGHTERDPLGRAIDEGTQGSLDSGGVHVPDQMQAGRARAIQEELRRRDAQRNRPKQELDYFQRLLKPF